jgi:diacylglycerol O-acyltransferase
MSMSERLGTLDASFLELEDADDSAHMHIGAVMVFEALQQGPPPLDELRFELGRRIEVLPHYRSRLSQAHTGVLRRPVWERDPDFAIDQHVRRAALPAPGREDELMAWCGDYWSARLDRARPLWEVVLLEGLEGGRWALATKTHHALIDGVGSVDVTQLLLDSSRARSRRHTPVARTSRVGPQEAGLADRLGDAVRGGTKLISHPARLLSEVTSAAELLLRDELVSAPHTSLMVPIGPHRRYAVVRARLSELKAVKNALGGTVNDAILAAATGGIRRLLQERNEELPERGLRAMVPVNIRTEADRLHTGNKVSSLFVHLPVYEPYPLRRYQLLAGEARDLKAGGQARGGAELVALSGLAPPILHALLARPAVGTRLFNLTITNVPGPRRPLYAFGARMEEVLPLVPLAACHAVGIAVVSYTGHVFFGLGADERAVPDLHVLRDGIEQSLAELRALARRPTRPAGAAAR